MRDLFKGNSWDNEYFTNIEATLSVLDFTTESITHPFYHTSGRHFGTSDGQGKGRGSEFGNLGEGGNVSSWALYPHNLIFFVE